MENKAPVLNGRKLRFYPPPSENTTLLGNKMTSSEERYGGGLLREVSRLLPISGPLVLSQISSCLMVKNSHFIRDGGRL